MIKKNNLIISIPLLVILFSVIPIDFHLFISFGYKKQFSLSIDVTNDRKMNHLL